MFIIKIFSLFFFLQQLTSSNELAPACFPSETASADRTPPALIVRYYLENTNTHQLRKRMYACLLVYEIHFVNETHGRRKFFLSFDDFEAEILFHYILINTCRLVLTREIPSLVCIGLILKIISSYRR